MSLGQLQNEAEGGDHFVNSNYRIITKDHQTGHYHSNSESGIFPPLIDHDDDNHEWTHVGHVDKVTGAKFRSLTKTESHPKGISHSEFCGALERVWNKDHGKYWDQGSDREKQLDHIESHPLVQKFLDHQRNLGFPPHDYRQMGNMGVWTHPVSGEQHIVARDHGFNEDVMKAYKEDIDIRINGLEKGDSIAYRVESNEIKEGEIYKKEFHLECCCKKND